MAMLGLLLLALQAPEAPPGRWDGVPPGSWVVFGTRAIAASAPREADTWKLDLFEPSPDGLPRLCSNGGDPVPQCRLPALGTGLREASRRADTLDLGGRRLACTVVEYLGDAGSLTVWSAEGIRLPGREMAAHPRRVGIPPEVVRADAVYVQNGGRLTSSLEVTDLAVPIEAAGRRLTCVVETATSVWRPSNGAGCLRRWKRWYAEEVPGRIVRQDRQCTADLVALEAYPVRDEVLDFRLNR